MKTLLAEKLLANTMGWSLEEVSNERPLLQAMANFKYDEYQQFSPGIRFIESLAQWLQQFKTIEDKITAYGFIKKKLIFISSDQMSHLVNLSYYTFIKPILIEKVAEILSIDKNLVVRIVNSEEFKNAHRRSLFVGLSDGSRIDQLRRYAHLDNEQILSTYSIDKDKTIDMLEELNHVCPNKKFSTIFLIDDFTASGASYARFEESKAKGKVLKLLQKILEPDSNNENNISSFAELIDNDDFSIHVIFYIATEEAIRNINTEINYFLDTQHTGRTIKIEIHAVQIIDDIVKQNIIDDPKLVELFKAYFDKEIVDKHYAKGKHSEPYLGFNECALPLVLNHNTPNNSIPLLWYNDNLEIMKGLFPRIKRHKE